MKIIWAIPEYSAPRTGAEKFYSQLKLSIAQKYDILSPEGIRSISGDNFRDLTRDNLKNLRILFKCDNKGMIFHDLTHRRMFLLANIILPLLFKRKLVIFVHEQFFLSGFVGIIQNIVNKIIFHNAFRIIVNSKSTAEWVKSFGIKDKKIFIFYPLIKSDNPKEEGRAYNEKVKEILCVSNTRRNKGQEYLIKALDILRDKDIKIVFAGMIKEKDYYDYLVEIVKSKALSQNISFVGFLEGEDLINAYKKADLFVMPTLKEGLGMVLLEAMAWGLPIIASNVGGIPEIIENGVDGLLVSSASPKELAEALKKLMENKESREYLGANALKKYNQMPSWNDSFKVLFENLLA